MNKRIGKSSVLLQNGAAIIGAASVAGKKEGEGPLRDYFDYINGDAYFGKKDWEEAESAMQAKAMELAMNKAGYNKDHVDFILAGDLLGQMIASSFGLKDLEIPLVGLYGACSTLGLGLGIGAMFIDGGMANVIGAVTSSHFASAEKEFRFPLDYGNQRPLAATWTVTGSGAFILGKAEKAVKPYVKVSAVTMGKIVDYGVKDSMNMGACMAPAAADTLENHFKDLNCQPDVYDRIFTGDLGIVGQKILIDMMKKRGYNIAPNHRDCGLEIFDGGSQDTHAGGSGCACSALTLAAYILPEMLKGHWKKVLFVPTGALLSATSFHEGKTVPGIAHGVVLEVVN